MESSGKLIVYFILFLLIFNGISKIFTGGFLEFSLVLFFAIVAFFGFILWKKPFGERLFFFVSLFSLTYLSSIWLNDGFVYLMLMLLSLIVFLLSFPKSEFEIFDEGEPTISENGSSVVFEPPQKIVSPGLYVANSSK